MEGDVADRKGTLSGGYHDRKQSRLDAAGNANSLKSKIQLEMNRLESLKKEILVSDQGITKARDDLSLLESKKSQWIAARESMQRIIGEKCKQELEIKDFIVLQEKALALNKSNSRQLELQMTSFESELGTPLVKKLSKREEETLNELSNQIERDSILLCELVNQRAQAEAQKNVLEIELNTNLKRRRQEMSIKLQESSSIGSNESISNRESELKTLSRYISKIENQLNSIDEQIEDLKGHLQEKVTLLDGLKSTQMSNHENLEIQKQEADKYLSKRNLILKKREEATKNIRELGALPEEAFEKYQKMNLKQLGTKLHKIHESLKKYSHVNKKAFEQYANFTKQREQLDERKDELNVSAKV